MSDASNGRLELPAEPASVPAARRFVRRRLVEWGAPADVLDLAALLVSELATNALIHSRGPFVLQVEQAGDRLRVQVLDRSAHLPTMQVGEPTATTGRGLRLLDELAEAWGVERSQGGGKSVWFEMGVPVRGAGR